MQMFYELEKIEKATSPFINNIGECFEKYFDRMKHYWSNVEKAFNYIKQISEMKLSDAKNNYLEIVNLFDEYVKNIRNIEVDCHVQNMTDDQIHEFVNNTQSIFEDSNNIIYKLRIFRMNSSIEAETKLDETINVMTNIQSPIISTETWEILNKTESTVKRFRANFYERVQ